MLLFSPGRVSSGSIPLSPARVLSILSSSPLTTYRSGIVLIVVADFIMLSFVQTLINSCAIGGV